MNMKMPKFLCSDFFLDIFFPNHCPGCERVIAWNKCFCDDCEGKLEYIEDYTWKEIFPSKINDEPIAFDYANALLYYEGTAKNSVLALKSRGASKFAEYAAERLALKLESDEVKDIDLITAVPMNRRKELSRGYNQAEIFANAMSGQIGKPCDFTLIQRSHSKKAQHELSEEERLKAAEANYHIVDSNQKLDARNVLLCDDIFTTGATVNRCAELLKQMGAKKVYVLTICRTPH